MFLRMQDFDFYPNLIISQILPILPKFYPIYPNFTQIFSNFTQISPKFWPNLSKKFAGGCGCTRSSYATVRRVNMPLSVTMS